MDENNMQINSESERERVNRPRNFFNLYFLKTTTILLCVGFLFFLFPQIAGATWACGDALVDSRDSKSYTTVLIGTQCWMRENINVGTRTDGANAQGTDCPSAGDIEKYCYSNNEANCTTYGGLYKWNQAMCGSTTAGAIGICPTGWHIPTHDEFTTLERAVCTSGSCATDFPYDFSTQGDRGTDEGTTLKIIDVSHFSGLLSGIMYVGFSLFSGTHGFFWSSNLSGGTAWDHHLESTLATVNRYIDNISQYSESIRCLQDSAPANTAPTLTSVADSPDPVKGGSTITITPTGQADTESDALYYYCNETGSATSADTLCTQANTSTASPYTGMTCSYAVSTGNTTRTVYCRAYDGTAYSTERTTTYTVDSTAPTLSETTAVTTPTTDTTPSYVFNTNEAGTITYAGSCTSATTSAVSGSNTITFTALSAGTYSNCTITVTDAVGNASTALPVTTFVVATVNIPTSLEASYIPTSTTITTSWSANSNSAGTQYYVENTTLNTNSGWITATTWDSTGLSCGVSYSFKVKSRDSTATAESAYTDSLSRAITCPGGGGVPAGFSFFETSTSTPAVTPAPSVVTQSSPAPALTIDQIKQQLIQLITEVIQLLLLQISQMQR